MKAITVFGPNNAKYVDVAMPELRDDSVLIRVKNTGLCATDVGIYTGKCSFVETGEITYPCRFGHEFSGVVEKVGKNVTKFKVGDKVITDSGVSCGECDTCKKGDYENCPHIKSVGTVNCWDGCYAEYVLMPEYNTYKMPDNLSYEEGALIEPLCISHDAFHNYQMPKDATVVVIGTGATGMGAVWLAKYFGAKKVIAIGRTDSKLEIAKQIGADEVINSKREDAVEALKKLTDGKGADLVIESSGSQAAFLQSLDMVKRDGRLSIISFYERNIDNVPVDKIALSRIQLVGAAGRFGTPAKVAEIMKNNPISIKPIITHRVKFEDTLAVFENMENSQIAKDKIKVMVEFD